MNILFIGKFQPPHLGHVLTVYKLLKKYKKITIGITEGKPQYFKRKKIKNIFDTIFYHKKNIKVILLDGRVDKKTIKIKDNFKLIISGNKNILKILNEFNFKTKYQPRTKGYGFSGTFQRRKLLK